MLSSVEQTEPIATIVSDLKSLETAYNAMNIEEQIKNNKANLVLSDKNLIEMTTIVEKMRKTSQSNRPPLNDNKIRDWDTSSLFFCLYGISAILAILTLNPYDERTVT